MAMTVFSLPSEDQGVGYVGEIVGEMGRGRGIDSAGQLGGVLGGIAQHVSELDDQMMSIASDTTPESLEGRRLGFVNAGGYSLTDAWAKISTPKKLITYLPRALAIGVLAPFPWQWFDVKGSTGIMRAFGSVEMILWYLLLPGVIYGLGRVFTHRHPGGLFLLAYILLVAVPLSLVVANLGTLFRLRLVFLLPLLLIAAAGDPVSLYQRLFRWIGTARIRHRSETPPHTENAPFETSGSSLSGLRGSAQGEGA